MNYLQSRYYDPEVGRFINADAYTSTGQGIIGNNMFAYCLNNPIKYIDALGYSVQTCFDESLEKLNLTSNVGRNCGTVALIVVGVAAGALLASGQRRGKPVNLPSKRKVKLDTDHIESGHTPDGSRNPKGNKSVFVGLTSHEIAKAIYEAYSNASKLQTQGPRVKLIGFSQTYNLVIEMWLNIVDLIIETAYPK